MTSPEVQRNTETILIFKEQYYNVYYYTLLESNVNNFFSITIQQLGVSGGNRTHINGFADRCLIHSTTLTLFGTPTRIRT